MALVYRHIRLDKNEPFYIGIGKRVHRAYDVNNRSKYWNNIAKNGYEVEILFNDLTYEQAKEKEKELISLYGRKDLNKGSLVNMTDGGEGTLNIIISDKQKQLISIRGKGRLVSEETRQKIRTKQLNVKRQPLSNEWKDKISQSNKGKIRTIEAKAKISNWHKENSAKRKIVFNYLTGVFYESAIEASVLLEIPLTTLYRNCRQKTKTNKYNLIYI